VRKTEGKSEKERTPGENRQVEKEGPAEKKEVANVKGELLEAREH